MKVNFSYVFRNETGKEIALGAKPSCTLKDVAIQALLHAARVAGQEPGAAEKRQRYDLACRIKTFGDATELKDDDRDLIRDCIGQGYHTMIAGPASYLLEGKEPPVLDLNEAVAEELPVLAAAK